MGFYRIGLPLWAIALTAAAWGCAPQVTTDEGKATQAAEGDGTTGTGTPANDPNEPPKDPPPGGCDTGNGDPPPKDPGEPGVCMGVLVGDGATCTPDADLKQQAMDACTAQGMGVQEMYEDGDCGGNEFVIAKVLCCGPGGGGDPPPPQNCTGFAIGDNVTCTPDADLKQQAMDACAAQGMGMQGIYEAFDCPGTESTMAKVVCCAPASP